MAITVEGTEQSASGLVTGELDVGPFSMEDGDLIVAAIMQDKFAIGPIGVGGPGAPMFTPDPSFTELEALHVMGTGAFMWLGYRFWYTGDPVYFPFYVTPSGVDYVAIEAAILFRGVDPAAGAGSRAFRLMGDSTGEFETSLFVESPFPGRKVLVISGGMMYGDTTLSWVFEPPITVGVRFSIPTGGNLAWSGKALGLGADYLQDANGTYDHRHITGIATSGGGTSMTKEAFGAIFYSFSETTEGLDWGWR